MTIFNEFQKKDFWRAVIKIAIAFFLFVVLLGAVFYWLILPSEDFKSYISTENALRKVIFAAAFAPVYGILLTLFKRTIKKM